MTSASPESDIPVPADTRSLAEAIVRSIPNTMTAGEPEERQAIERTARAILAAGASSDERIRQEERTACVELASRYCWARYKGRPPTNLKTPAVFTSHEWEKIAEAMHSERAESDEARSREAS